jgi:hypothetical protein
VVLSVRSQRIWRDLASEPSEHLQIWLTTGVRAAVDPRLSMAVRTAAVEQVAVCQALLARRGARAASPATSAGVEAVDQALIPAALLADGDVMRRGVMDAGGA